MLLGKVPFLHTLFLENKVQPSEKNYRAMIFSGNEGQMQKFANLEQKKKEPKSSLIPFYDYM